MSNGTKVTIAKTNEEIVIFYNNEERNAVNRILLLEENDKENVNLSFFVPEEEKIEDYFKKMDRYRFFKKLESFRNKLSYEYSKEILIESFRWLGNKELPEEYKVLSEFYVDYDDIKKHLKCEDYNDLFYLNHYDEKPLILISLLIKHYFEFYKDCHSEDEPLFKGLEHVNMEEMHFDNSSLEYLISEIECKYDDFYKPLRRLCFEFISDYKDKLEYSTEKRYTKEYLESLDWYMDFKENGEIKSEINLPVDFLEKKGYPAIVSTVTELKNRI